MAGLGLELLDHGLGQLDPLAGGGARGLGLVGLVGRDHAGHDDQADDHHERDLDQGEAGPGPADGVAHAAPYLFVDRWNQGWPNRSWIEMTKPFDRERSELESGLKRAYVAPTIWT